jgi:hypothetical protein
MLPEKILPEKPISGSRTEKPPQKTLKKYIYTIDALTER